jgi:hypothetical protein
MKTPILMLAGPDAAGVPSNSANRFIALAAGITGLLTLLFPALTLPAPQKFTLANGLRVWLLEQHEVPLVQANLVVLSGASGLVFEVIWVRQLALWVGHGTVAVSLVVAAFLIDGQIAGEEHDLAVGQHLADVVVDLAGHRARRAGDEQRRPPREMCECGENQRARGLGTAVVSVREQSSGDRSLARATAARSGLLPPSSLGRSAAARRSAVVGR